jgi:hypothetical protein
MAGRSPRRRRAVALVLCLGLVGALAACDGGGSGRSAGTTSTTRRRKPHPSTTTASTSTTTTTLGGAQPDTAVTDPDAPTTTTSPSGAAPCGAQASHLTAAVTGGDLGAVPVAGYTVDHCRLASSNLIWGAVTLTPKPGQTVAPMTVVLERIGSIWQVHSFASGPTGCDAPAPVPAQLGLGC